MQKKNMNEESNDWGSIGIGAMIVFIALIPVSYTHLTLPTNREV